MKCGSQLIVGDVLEWSEVKDAIRADLLARGLKEPRLRLRALDRLEKLLAGCFPNFLSNPKLLLDAGKDAVSKRLARLKGTEILNGAEKSVLNEVFARLPMASSIPPAAGKMVGRYSSIAGSQSSPTRSAGRKGAKDRLGLPPVIGGSSRILILGTMPGEDSIRFQQYYAHDRNQFWMILAKVYGEAVGAVYSERLEFLHRRGLALWDVLRSAERAGSLDSSIKNEAANNIAGLVATHRGLNAIVFNGLKALTFYRRHIEPQPTVGALRTVVLPSTSPTQGRHVLQFEEKVDRWRMLEIL